MVESRYIAVNDLPASLQRALKTLGYGRKDIAVKAADSYSLADMGADGCRSFNCAVDLVTGEARTMMGSWGGANMFNPTNRTDLDTTSRPMEPHFALIQGSEGGGQSVYAFILVHPDNLARLLPAPSAEVTDAMRKALGYIKSYKPSYRAEAFERAKLGNYGPDNAIVKACLALGLVSINKVGAIQITTAGKNAAGRVY